MVSFQLFLFAHVFCKLPTHSLLVFIFSIKPTEDCALSSFAQCFSGVCSGKPRPSSTIGHWHLYRGIFRTKKAHELEETERGRCCGRGSAIGSHRPCVLSLGPLTAAERELGRRHSVLTFLQELDPRVVANGDLITLSSTFCN